VKADRRTEGQATEAKFSKHGILRVRGYQREILSAVATAKGRPMVQILDRVLICWLRSSEADRRLIPDADVARLLQGVEAEVAHVPVDEFEDLRRQVRARVARRESDKERNGLAQA
jgi:hypothetical protein